MRKIVLAAALVLSVVGLTHAAGAAAYSATDANYTWGLDTAISTSTSYDSVIGNATPADSIAIRSNWYPKQGWEYILVHDGLTTSADSCTLAIVVKCEDGSGNKLYEFAADTIVSSSGGAYELDIGGGAIGHRFDVVARAIAATDRGNSITFNRIYMYKRRVLSTMSRSW